MEDELDDLVFAAMQSVMKDKWPAEKVYESFVRLAVHELTVGFSAHKHKKRG